LFVDGLLAATTTAARQHMGQFAADYRRQFGELPSETFKRPSRD
jgi:hypothetical protein